jgi:hypothetical protein
VQSPAQIGSPSLHLGVVMDCPLLKPKGRKVTWGHIPLSGKTSYPSSNHPCGGTFPYTQSPFLYIVSHLFILSVQSNCNGKIPLLTCLRSDRSDTIILLSAIFFILLSVVRGCRLYLIYFVAARTVTRLAEVPSLTPKLLFCT